MTKSILNEKEYWNISYNKRVAAKIRSVRSPLRMGPRERAGLVVVWGNLERFVVWNFLGGNFREGEYT
jgi:hypothetical protein